MAEAAVSLAGAAADQAAAGTPEVKDQAPALSAEQTPEQKAAAEKTAADLAAQTPEQKAAAEKEAAAKVVPETYAEFKMPEGVKLDEAQLKEATPLFKELGLTQDRAQKAVDFYAKQRAQDVANQQKAWGDFQAGWVKEAKADPEFGKDKFDASMGTVRKAITTFAKTPAEVKAVDEALNLTGAGNNPAILRLLYRAGLAIGEDKISAGGQPAFDKKDAASVMFPNQGKVA